MDTAGELMVEVPVSDALAEYRGKRYRISFSGDDWVALIVDPGDEIPDAFARGDAPAGLGHFEHWAKVPRSVLNGVFHVHARGLLHGHDVSLRRRLPDGRINVEFVGDPAAAREMGLAGDQYTGWTGAVSPDDLTDIHVEEIRRA